MLALVCMSGLNTKKFHLLDHFMENYKRFEEVSVLDVPAYEQFSVEVRRVYRGWSIKCARSMQETVMLIERQRTEERDTMSTDVGSSSPSAILWRLSRCM